MNYDCMTPISPFITIATKFLSKHCIKRVLDTEMNGHDLSGGAKILRGRCKTISGEVRTSPHLPSKSGLDANKSPQLERAY
jgi:hypothetical protein